MAAGSSVESRDVDEARIPSELLAHLDEMFSTLKREVIRQSCCRALARTGESEVPIVNKDDLVNSARAALTEAVSGLDEAMTPRSPHYDVRRVS
jgi:hypothetical protein